MLEYPTWFEPFEKPLHYFFRVGEKVNLSIIPATWSVALILIVISWLVTSRLQRVPGRLQSAFELMVEGGDKFVKDVIGPEGARYTPFILTLFVFIFFSSAIGLVPGFSSPTSSLNTTAALAIAAFLYVNYHAIRTVGIVPFVKGFFPPPLWMAWLLGPIEILSHLIRPLTLAVRLFGNIFGEDVFIAVLIGFGIAALKVTRFVPLPLQLPIALFSLFTDLVQAGVFCMLVTLYIALLTQHAHGGHGHEEHPPEGEPGH